MPRRRPQRLTQGLMRMNELELIQGICEGYIAYAEELERKRKPTDGLLGMGSKPADDPCHDRFAEDMEKALNDMASQSPSSETVYSVLSYIYHLPVQHREPASIFWMLCAVHGLTLDMTKLLGTDDALALKKQYSADFSRWERLPAQQKVYKALKQSAIRN